jgi:hypothetical protein
MLIGLLGRMGSGKGTVADELVEVYGFRQDSYAATLKDITALLFNWDRSMLVGDTIESRSEREQVDEWWSEKLGIENFTPRLALQLIGTDVFRNNFHKDIWMLSVMARYNEDENVVISDCRFPNEVQAIRELGGRIIRVDRGEEPFWWEIAKKAAAGDEDAIAEMAKPHINVHASEWAWANEAPDEVIHNNGTLQQLYGMVRLLDNRYHF